MTDLDSDKLGKKIRFNLDDGIKANYGKFGELSEEIKGLKYEPTD